MTESDKQPKPHIEYPCIWHYTLIGMSAASIQAAVDSIMLDRAHTCTAAHKSTRGKYLSFSLSLPVSSETERNDLFQRLSQHPDITIVI
jgi:uncharacterized protein